MSKFDIVKVSSANASDPWQALAFAIVRSACDDYETWLRQQLDGRTIERAKKGSVKIYRDFIAKNGQEAYIWFTRQSEECDFLASVDGAFVERCVREKTLEKWRTKELNKMEKKEEYNKMNTCIYSGRITRDLELKGEEKKYCRFTLAVNKDFEEGADFIDCVVFGKNAENLCKFKKKGNFLIVKGRTSTGSYEKDGTKFKTFACMVEQLDFAIKENGGDHAEPTDAIVSPSQIKFSAIDEDIPF